MNALIISLLMAVLSIMQNPDVPAEVKVQVYNQTLPVITKYMEEETKPVPDIGEATSTEVVTPSVGAENAPEAPLEVKDEPKVNTPGGVNVEA